MTDKELKSIETEANVEGLEISEFISRREICGI